MRSRSIVDITTAIAAAVLLAAGLAGYQVARIFAGTGESLVHTKDVTIALERTLSLLRDAETGQRGFLLTRRESYLVPYSSAVTQIHQQLGQLETLMANDAAASADLTSLTTHVEAKMDELAHTIALARAAKRGEAL
jgi:CHASE3 domain sensor protein